MSEVFEEALSNPAQFGFTNTEDACLFPTPLLAGLPQTPITICDNPDEYVFWDSLHPSSRTHEILADRAFAALNTADVPEPQTPAWLALAGAGGSFAAFKEKEVSFGLDPLCLPG